MFYGQSQQNSMVDNKYDESKLTLEQQEQIPDWASDYLDAYDETWKEKLINAFFKDNIEMQDKIEGMK